jgi:hypothetical protein
VEWSHSIIAELDLEKLRMLAGELGYWPATTDQEHIAKLREQDARYERVARGDPEGTVLMLPCLGTLRRHRSAEPVRRRGCRAEAEFE